MNVRSIRPVRRLDAPSPRRSPSLVRSAHGFTLIEILVTVAIIALFTGMVALPVVGHLRDAKVVAARTQVATLESALRTYQLDNGFYPTTEQGLAALLTAPTTRPVPASYRTHGYWERDFIPKDPWGGEYHYLSPGIHGEIDVWSLGADQQPDGDGDAKDLGNWDLGRR
ncbi:MAG: type II secretion system major pseudopilin GspG [Deltaproteobacteria bacterium]|nr:type II secretion system major pseudopilin GspG [Deltaproteobacteria bacterium]